MAMMATTTAMPATMAITGPFPPPPPDDTVMFGVEAWGAAGAEATYSDPGAGGTVAWAGEIGAFTV
jgi:hypothetical protein